MTDSLLFAIGSKNWTPDHETERMRVMTATLRGLELRLQRIKRKLDALGDLRPGHLSQQYNVCGNPNCRCKANPPQKHGPYYQLGWTRKGKSTTRFIRKPDVEAVKIQLRNHELLLELVDQWVEVAIEICEFKLSQSRRATKSPGKT